MIPVVAGRPRPPPATTASTDITVTTGNNPFPATALLGLDASEAAFQSLAIDSVLPGFSRLADSPDLCWLPQEATQSAPFAVGDTVEILGHRLTVAGFFNDASFGKLRELTGDPLSPVDLSGLGNQPSVTLGGGQAGRGASSSRPGVPAPAASPSCPRRWWKRSVASSPAS